MADILTFEEHRGPITGKTIAWVGDGNNVCASFIHAAAAFEFKLKIACPAHFHPDLVDLARASKAGAEITMSEDPVEAVKGADCVVTDTWVSMGDEDSTERFDMFEPFQVDEDLMRLAQADAVFLHCLPAHRGEEVTDEVIDGAQSLVWQEAENRIHAQKSVLAWCFGAVA
jgi:ornithine carbamoyltransferase